MVRSFKIQYFILSVPLMGQKYENGGFRVTVKNKYYRSTCFTDYLPIFGKLALKIDLPGELF